MKSEFFHGRRKLFQAGLESGVALFHNPTEAVRTQDIHYRYRPDSDFYYFTGFDEPDASCLLTPESMILFVRPKDPEKELWTGRRAGVEGAVEIFGADEAYPLDQWEEIFLTHVGRSDRLYFSMGIDEPFNEKVLALYRKAQFDRPRSGSGPIALSDPRQIVHEMRLIKSSEEIDVMKTAISIACEAHQEAMKGTRPGKWEYEIEALLEYIFRAKGAIGPAYPSIVAGGANATILHYQTNQCELKKGDLLLVDAGAEYGYYAADVTRTYPVSGKFSSAQRDLYSLVLRAQREAIRTVRPGVTWDTPHAKAVEVLTEGLRELGLLKGDSKKLIEENALRPFYMHRTSHWLGMDVHDVGLYRIGGEPRLLREGMVLTVEPGLYVSDQSSDIEPPYRGVGIRIEDDVLVTRDSHEVLSASAPKEIDELEEIVGKACSIT